MGGNAYGTNILKFLVCLLALVSFLPAAVAVDGKFEIRLHSNGALVGVNHDDSAEKQVVMGGGSNKVGPLVVVWRQQCSDYLFKSWSPLRFPFLYNGRISTDCRFALVQWHFTEDSERGPGLKISLVGYNLYSTSDGNKVVVKTNPYPTHWRLTPGIGNTWLLVHICILLLYSITNIRQDQIHKR